MPSVIKEYDLNAYHRKFGDSYCMFSDGKVRYVTNVYDKFNDKGETEYYARTHESETAGAKERKAEMVYHHFQSGYYEEGGEFLCFVRKMSRSFHVGVTLENYRIYRYQGGWYAWNRMWFLKNQPISKPDVAASLASVGPISRRLFVGNERVYYLNTAVGYREGTKITLAHKAFVQEFKDALRGHECQIASM